MCILTKPLFEPKFFNVKAENYMLAHILFLKGTVLDIVKYVLVLYIILC